MLSKIITLLKWLFISLTLLTIIVILFINFAPTFGSKPDILSQRKIANSANFDKDNYVFKNLISTQASTIQLDNIKATENGNKSGNLLMNFLLPPEGKNPKLVNTDKLDLIESPLLEDEFVWLGHSSILFKIDNKTIITDPVFYPAAPVSMFVRPFKNSNPITTEDLPAIDAVLISHDHYDHLDYRAIQEIKNKVKHFYVPLGVKAHLQGWGVADNKITELDWYEETSLLLADKSKIKSSTEADNRVDVQAGAMLTTTDESKVRLIFTPSRHFSGRGVFNHRQTLWGSWVIKSPERSIYFSGDGGYSPEFKKIGKKFGGFDIAFIEDGAYNVRWQDVHMLPEQSAQAGIDVGAKVVLPIHWGKYDLSTHEWQEPVRRIKAAMDLHNKSLANADKVRITTPRIGQRFSLDNIPTEVWWE